MIQPLALLVTERAVPCRLLTEQLEKLQYRVLSTPEAARLAALARHEKPMIVVMDLPASPESVLTAIRELRVASDTGHIPLIAVVSTGDNAIETQLREAGATLVTTESATNRHLKQLLEQALQVE